MKKLVLMFISALICGMVFTSCDSDKISDQARVYLNEVLDIMEKNSINKTKINWVDFKNEVFSTVPTAQIISDTYPGIRKALTLLGDNHSHFISPSGLVIYVGPSGSLENIGTPAIPNDVGYVKVTAYSGSSNDAQAIAFATLIQYQIRNQDNFKIKGWIVDLRNNTGGNMWPMLVGIGPILGEGVAGYFIFSDGRLYSWGFENGISVSNGYPITQLSDSYKLLIPNPKVAVLLNSAVSSSGEVIAISFIGRDNTKSFGSATCGLSTANSTFKLSDNATLNLTTAHLADRNKKTYGVPINPDVKSSIETIINDALAWIRE